MGKTKIIRSLQEIFRVATGNQLKAVINWKLGFIHEGQEYEWELKSSKGESNYDREADDSDNPIIVYEKIVKTVADKQIVLLLERSTKDNLLDGKTIPKLKKTESAINLLSEEATIVPLYHGFKRFIVNDSLPQKRVIVRVNPELNTKSYLCLWRSLKKSLYSWVTVRKAYQLQESYPAEFYKIKENFTEIFASVTDFKISITKEKKEAQEAKGYEFAFCLKEKHSCHWVSQPQISTGVFRTLVHIIDISLAPKGTVIVIDEVENSLGINCMPGLTDFIMNQAPHLQFILTSHHPYIISKIPYHTWKLVSRKGNHVKVRNATDIPHLKSGSRLNKFVQLTQVPEL